MTRSLELWSSLTGPGLSTNLGDIVSRAARLERDGWDGASILDSQMYVADSFVALTACAAATTTLRIGTGTSNPATRHPSVVASAAAAVQQVSGGRMTLSLGRGDTSLAYIGAPPVSLDYFERAVRMVRAYLRGEAVPTDEASAFVGSLSERRDASASAPETASGQMTWFPKGFRPPEIELAASGPKVIALSCRYADRVAFALGADIERLRWAVNLAREALEGLGRDPASVRFAAYVPLYPHRDVKYAIELSEFMVGAISRYSINKDKVAGPSSDMDRANLSRVAAGDFAGLDKAFLHKYGLIGDPARCVDRILEIHEAGIDKLMFWTADAAGRPGESYAAAVHEVLAKVKAHTA